MIFSLRILFISCCFFLPSLLSAEKEASKTPKKEVFGPQADLASPQPPKQKAIPKRLNLTEVFSVEENPGMGTLEYIQGENVEKIMFGKVGGLYGLGMVFKGSKLPHQYGKDFSSDTIIQIALGRLKSRLEGQIPQFCAATLISNRIPKRKTVFPVMMPAKGKIHSQKNMALLLFSSPETPNDQSDEQKLKNTFFAQTGTLTLSQKGKAKTIKVKAQGKNLWFKMYPLQMKYDLVLNTPFSADHATLQGTIQFPLYAPHGKAATQFTQRIAGESLEGTMSLSKTAKPSTRKPTNTSRKHRRRSK